MKRYKDEIEATILFIVFLLIIYLCTVYLKGSWNPMGWDHFTKQDVLFWVGVDFVSSISYYIACKVA